MVSITSSFTVVPSESTPKGTLWLSESDQISPLLHVPSIYVYTPEPDQSAIPKAIERMRDSLSDILVHFYPLAGRLRWVGGGRLEVDCNEAGVTLMEAKTSKRLEDYGDFRPNETIRELIPRADYSKSLEELPLLLVQLTKFSCGGLSVGVSMSHTMADGVAAIHFINSWAKLSRRETLGKDEMPFLDRTVLKHREPLAPPPPPPPLFEHLEFKPFPLLLGASDHLAQKKKETTTELLKLTKEQVDKIKNKANEEIKIEEKNMSKNRSFSRYEAVTAHIWKCACNARKNEHDQPTMQRIIADIRHRLNPPLPRNYFGNATGRAFSTCLSGDIISKPLSFAAQKLREGIEILTDEYVRSHLDFIANLTDVNSLRISPNSAEALFLGNPNLSVGSWTSMSMYDADFGWGKPVYVGPGSMIEDGKGTIVPTAAGDGSVLVAMRLQTDHMEDFKKFFYMIFEY